MTGWMENTAQRTRFPHYAEIGFVVLSVRRLTAGGVLMRVLRQLAKVAQLILNNILRLLQPCDFTGDLVVMRLKQGITLG
ncbi:hypothetical protein D3C74_489180 [compost metagenome]